MLDIRNKLLAILFSSPEPVELAQLQTVFPQFDGQQLESEIDSLAEEFKHWQQALEIRRIAGGFRLSTLPEHHETIRLFLKTKPSSKLSLAALETLAVIAYKQPITLPEVSEIRGVKGSSTIRTLLEKKLVETRGRKKTVGRPMQYGTTREFLVHFGLNDLSELPTLKEFEQILQDGGETAESPTEPQP